MVAKVLVKAGVVVWAQMMMHKGVVNTVLLYGIEIWVVTGAMLTVLVGFHHWMARRVAKR